ncbi:uncharacterized protein BDV17DRAFT_28983 [Aspergillus undulatus]|uniref:uncharacterized protein n=1 Tax=Aspergillus undulatus TaxID=1810928 RepID=UPI003CCE1838
MLIMDILIDRPYRVHIELLHCYQVTCQVEPRAHSRTSEDLKIWACLLPIRASRYFLHILHSTSTSRLQHPNRPVVAVVIIIGPIVIAYSGAGALTVNDESLRHKRNRMKASKSTAAGDQPPPYLVHYQMICAHHRDQGTVTGASSGRALYILGARTIVDYPRSLG